MFRKLVSNLPFSPALVGQLGFYARRLRKEEFTRRLGLIFTVLALIMQSLAVFSPPEQALASNTSDIIKGGVNSVGDILNVYDNSGATNDFKDIMDYFGVTRAELAAMNKNKQYICSSDHSIISFGRQHHYSSSEGEIEHHVPKQAGGFSTLHSVPLYRFDSVNNMVNCYASFIGNSKSVGWFAIMQKCGNFQIKKNVRKLPLGHFVTATCRVVQGYAYDERQLDLKTRVYLYFNGKPGVGKQFGPVQADQATPTSTAGAGHGFSFVVPEEYQKSGKPTTVWAVMQPLPGWSASTVQFDNTVQIPGSCTPTKIPIAACTDLKISYIDRTHIAMAARASASEGATISAYTFTVTNKSGKKVYEKIVSSSEGLASLSNIEFKDIGDYTVKVVVKTSLGDKTSVDCAGDFHVCPPSKCMFSPTISSIDENCKPCPYDSSIWIKDEKNCRPQISESKEAKNLTQNVTNANGTTARITDRIEYTIYTTNVGSGAVTASINESLGDVLEYAKLLDSGGGTFDDQTKTLSWGNVTLAAQKTDTRKFVVQVLDTIPATPHGSNNPAAFNCVMTNSYGNTVDISVQCPLTKQIEGATHVLPATGPGENVVFGTILIMVVTYFYVRNRQMNKEVRLIKKEFNAGTI